jgi:hypothetical protein
MPDVVLTATVGTGGANRVADVRNVQALLNKVRPEWGGPAPKLVEDGAAGPLTRGAIGAFQTFQMGTIFTADSRVDPKGRTLARLNHIAGSTETPSMSVFVSAEPLVHYKQPTNMTCWAASGTMLVAARDRTFVTIPQVMATADSNDAHPTGYATMFTMNIGLPPADTGRYTQAIGLRVGPPVNFTVAGWLALLRAKGPIGVVGLSPFLHIRVISQMAGDGSVFGTRVLVHDPAVSTPYNEIFLTFAQRYESAAGVNSKMNQLWHR